MPRLLDRSLVLYWLAVIVPAVVVGAVTLNLLRHEQDRQQRLAEQAVEDRSDLAASTLEASLTDMQADLAQRLSQLGADPRDELRALLDQDPLLQRAFTYVPERDYFWCETRGGSARQGDGADPAAAFQRLFGELLVQWRPAVPEQPQTDWQQAAAGTTAEAGPSQPTALDPGPAQGQSGASLPPPQRSKVVVNTYNDMSYQQAAPPPQQQTLDIDPQEMQQQTYVQIDESSRNYRNIADNRASVQQLERILPADASSGWQPWYAENHQYVLVWYTPDGFHHVHGVVLDLPALAQTLLQAVPDPAAAETFTLVDAANREMATRAGHQAARWQSAPAAVGPHVHAVEVRLGDALPNWRLRHLAPLGMQNAAATRLAMGLLVATFVVAIVAGGTLLIWQARRYMHEARQKTSFVSNVSHEFKTPLTSIRMYAELLQAGRVADPQRRDHMLHVIVTESDRLGRLVANVLDFSRLEQDRQRYDLRPLDLAALITHVLDAQQTRFDHAGMALHRDLPAEPVSVLADRDATEQVLLNLTENALKYAAAGGQLTIRLRPHRDHASVQVADRGAGVPRAQRERIFDAFVRLDDSLTARTGGTGLGLSIARRLMRGMHGDLYCDANPGGGACFTLHLPLASDAHTATRSPSAHRHPQS